MNKYSDKEINKSLSISHKKDICLAVAVLMTALVLALVFGHDKNKAGNADGVLEITIDGEVYGTYPLEKEQEINVVSSYGRNTVVIEQGVAYVTEADCPDKICAGMPRISKDGEIICCLPHRLFLKVKSEKSAEYDAVAY